MVLYTSYMDDNKLSEQEILCFVTWSLYYGKPTILNILTNLKKKILLKIKKINLFA